MRRLTLLALVLALAVVSGMAASSAHGRVDGKAVPAATSAVSGNITLAHWASSPVETQLLKDVIKAFHQKYPNIHVTRRALDPYPEQMLAQFAARKPPDVFYVDSNVIPDWIKQGVLLDLTPLIRQYKFSTKPFFPRLLGAFQQGGKTYGLPKDWSPLAMEVNTAMLSKAGVAAPKTWVELRNAALKIRSSNAIPDGRPICLSADWARLLAFIYQNNGAFLNASKTAPVVTSPANHAAVSFYVGLIQSGLAGTPAQLGVGWCGEALGKEKAAIIFEGNWVMPFMAEQFPNTKFAVAPMVRNKAQGNLAFTVSYSIAKDTKNKNAAWTLLTFLTGKQGMGIWTSKGLALPSRSDVKPVAGRTAFLSAAPYARPWQFAPGFAKVITVAGNELTAVVEGKQTIDKMLLKIQSEASAALKKK
jgi:multiple sugar transport system substrate-binding protein